MGNDSLTKKNTLNQRITDSINSCFQDSLSYSVSFSGFPKVLGNRIVLTGGISQD